MYIVSRTEGRASEYFCRNFNCRAPASVGAPLRAAQINARIPLINQGRGKRAAGPVSELQFSNELPHYLLSKTTRAFLAECGSRRLPRGRGGGGSGFSVARFANGDGGIPGEPRRSRRTFEGALV